MQPQEPTDPTTNSTPASTPPEPADQKPAEVPTPATPTDPTPPVAPIAAAAPAEAPHKPPTKLIAIILGAVLVIAAIISAYFLLFSGIKLATYNGDKFSIQYPEGYEQKEENGSVLFTEKGDQANASVLTAVFSEFPEELTQDQVDIYRQGFKDQFESKEGGILDGSDVSVKDAKVEDIDFKGAKALKITGQGVKEGKDVGTLTAIIVLDTKKIYVIALAAHTSDPGVAKAVDTILNSFTLK